MREGEREGEEEQEAERWVWVYSGPVGYRWTGNLASEPQVRVSDNTDDDGRPSRKATVGGKNKSPRPRLPFLTGPAPDPPRPPIPKNNIVFIVV